MSIASYLSQLLNSSGLVPGAKIASGAIGLSQLTATGTPSGSNFLRGDNTWAAAGISSITAGTGLTGGTITTSGTIALDVYTGSTANNQTYPVGTTITVDAAANTSPIVNTSYNVYSPPTAGSNFFRASSQGSGSSLLTGTWRARGLVYSTSSCGNTYYTYLSQRVA